MRILVLSDVLAPWTTGGAGRVARELGDAFSRAGDEVHFLTREVPGSREPDAAVSRFPHPARAGPGALGKRGLEVLHSFRPDLIWTHQPLSTFLSLPESSSPPLVYTFHSSWPEEVRLKHSPVPRLLRSIASPLLTRIERSALERSRRIVVLSEFSRREVARRYGFDSILIPGGVHTGRFRPKKSKPSPGRVRLITLRNLVPRMGLGSLVEAMTRLPAHIGLDVGGSGPLKAKLERQILSLGLESRVRLLGHIPDSELAGFYQSGDWFVLPTSHLEGFGLVILESLSCGTPVLGTRVGAIPELLERFDPRWIIEEPTAGAIAEKVESVLGWRPPSPQRLHALVAAEFDWRLIAQSYRSLFEDILG